MRRSRNNGGLIGKNYSVAGFRGVHTINSNIQYEPIFNDSSNFYNEVFKYAPEIEFLVSLLPQMSDGDQKFAGLYNVTPGHSSGNSADNKVAFGLSGSSCIVDWGDGTTASYVSGATAYHNYAYDGITGFTSPHTGEKYVLVQLEVPSGETFSDIDLSGAGHPDFATNTYLSRLCAFRIAGQELFDIDLGSYTRRLRYIDLVGTNNYIKHGGAFGAPADEGAIRSMSSHNTIRRFDGAEFWKNKSGVSGAVIPYSGLHNGWMDSKVNNLPFLRSPNASGKNSVTNLDSGIAEYYGRLSGEYIPRLEIPDGVTNANSMFRSSGIKRIGTVVGNDVESATTMFYGCNSLEYVGSINLPKCRDFSYMFQSCPVLKDVGKINGPTSGGITSTAMFASCSSLREVEEFNCRIDNGYQTFFSCYDLQSVPSGLTFAIAGQGGPGNSGANLSQFFLGCMSLTTIPDAFYDLEQVYAAAGMVSRCFSLEHSRGFSLGDFSSPSYNTKFYEIFRESWSNKVYASFTVQPSSSSNSIFGANYSSFLAAPTTSVILYGFDSSVDLRYKMLSADALDEFFTNLGTAVGSATLQVGFNPGSTGCNTSIATAKGFTVTT